MSCFCKLVYEIDAKFSQNRGLQYRPTILFILGEDREYGQEQKERETSLSTFKRFRSFQVVGSYRIKICPNIMETCVNEMMCANYDVTCTQISLKFFTKWVPNRVEAQSSGCVAVRFQFFWGCWSECQWEEHLPGGHWCGGPWAGHSEGGVEEASWWLALVPVEFQPPCWTNRSFFLPMPTHWNLIVFSPSWQISSVLGSFLLLESFPCLVVVFRRHDSFNMIDHTSLAMMLSEGPFMLESYYVQTELSFWYGGIPSVAGVSCHQLW